MDRPIHLAGFEICQKPEHSEASVNINVPITQSTLDGMLELIKWLDGYVSGVHGGISTVPGAFDLVMFYRTLRHEIYEAEHKFRDRREPAEPATPSDNLARMCDGQ